MQRTSGFTLIELVIVLVILGVLAAVAVPQFSGTAETADRTALRAQAKAFSSANAANVANCRLNPDGDGCKVTGSITDNSSLNGSSGALVSLLGDDYDYDAYNVTTVGEAGTSSAPDCGGPNATSDVGFRFEITETTGTAPDISIGSTYVGCLDSN